LKGDLFDKRSKGGGGGGGSAREKHVSKTAGPGLKRDRVIGTTGAQRRGEHLARKKVPDNQGGKREGFTSSRPGQDKEPWGTIAKKDCEGEGRSLKQKKRLGEIKSTSKTCFVHCAGLDCLDEVT